jgi:hypothetical protein
VVRLIDASPIPLSKVCHWAKLNGRIRGMKLHVVYDPVADVPTCVEVTPANVNYLRSKLERFAFRLTCIRQFARSFAHSWGAMVSRVSATAVSTASAVRPIAFRVLDFCEGLLSQPKDRSD